MAPHIASHDERSRYYYFKGKKNGSAAGGTAAASAAATDTSSETAASAVPGRQDAEPTTTGKDSPKTNTELRQRNAAT